MRGKIRGKKIVTTKPRPGAARYPDLVERERDRGAPDRVWIADVTYVKTLEGMAYVSFVQDAGTRSILGFTVDERQAASLVVRSVQQAVSYRKRQNPSFVTDGVIHHSDAGSQFTSLALGRELSALGMAGSIGRVGTAHDNAMMESTIGLYKTELINNKVWKSVAELEAATAAWVAWFNQKRLHSALDYQSPQGFEAEYAKHRGSLKRAA